MVVRKGPFRHLILEFNEQLSQIPDSLSGKWEIWVVQGLLINEKFFSTSKRLCKDGFQHSWAIKIMTLVSLNIQIIV